MLKHNDKTERITIRLSKDQLDFISEMCSVYGFSTSDYIRMLVNQQKYIVDKKKEMNNDADK